MVIGKWDTTVFFKNLTILQMQWDIIIWRIKENIHLIRNGQEICIKCLVITNRTIGRVQHSSMHFIVSVNNGNGILKLWKVCKCTGSLIKLKFITFWTYDQPQFLTSLDAIWRRSWRYPSSLSLCADLHNLSSSQLLDWTMLRAFSSL